MKNPNENSSVLASLLRDRGVLLYGALTLLGAPFFLYRKWRLTRYLQLDSEFDWSRWKLRFPAALNAQPKNAREVSGPRAMFFTQGWGEVQTMKPLIEALREQRPEARLLFTTRHHEAIMPAAQLSDEEVSPLPFDNAISVARWLRKTRPDVVIFYERFFYANLLRALSLRGVPFIILHARMRRSTSRPGPNVKFKKWQLRGLSAICLSAPEYLPGVAQLIEDSSQIHIVGSIKFPRARPTLDAARTADLRAWVTAATSSAPLLIAGSTHPTEEEFALDAWQKVRAEIKNRTPVLLLAPRKPDRADEIMRLLCERGLRVSRRSTWKSENKIGAVDVLLLDTLGELGTAYQWANGAFVSGVANESQNITEPLAWGVPVSYGPICGNFESEQELCETAGVGFRVSSPDALAAHWTQLLQDPALHRELSAKAQSLFETQRMAFDRTLQVLIDAVDSVS